MAWTHGQWRRRIARSVVDPRGSAATEAAIATPLILMLVVGAVEFGNMLYNANMIQTGVRDAARYLARVGQPLEAELQAKQLAITGSITGDGPRRVAWWDAEDIVVSYRRIDNPLASSGRRGLRGGDEVVVIRVATEISYGGFGTLRVIGQDGVTLAFAHEERFVGE